MLATKIQKHISILKFYTDLTNMINTKVSGNHFSKTSAHIPQQYSLATKIPKHIHLQVNYHPFYTDLTNIINTKVVKSSSRLWSSFSLIKTFKQMSHETSIKKKRHKMCVTILNTDWQVDPTIANVIMWWNISRYVTSPYRKPPQH